MTKITQAEATSFNGLGIAPRLLDILAELKYSIPTPIQVQSIPTSLEGKDLVGIAQTGTGKTLAFGIPMLQLLAANKGKGLVILPTRELALQVDENLRVIGKKIGLRTAVLIGGEAMGRQLNALRGNPHIVIATPGRLVDHVTRRSVSLKEVKILVLDEADMMLDMGFLPQIKEILKSVPKQRQTMLFSATMPNQIMKIATEYMALPVRIEVAPAGTAAENVEQEIYVIDRDSKFGQLRKILTETIGSVLIFARTKHSVKNLTQKISQAGFSAAEIHSNRSLGQRREALNGFKVGQYRVLVATDIAARGIDVKGIELVINYDLPENSEDYVHRIGRTGRAGKSGKAISFALPNQSRDVKDIERLINKTLNITKIASDPNAPKSTPAERQREDRGKRGVRNDRERGGRKPFRQGSKPFGKGNKHAGFGRREQGRLYATTSASDTIDIIDRFNPFKESAPRNAGASRNAGTAYGKSRGSRFKGRSDTRPPRTMTDKERFRKSMRPDRY